MSANPHQTIHTGGLSPLEQELALASFGPGAHDPAQTRGVLVGDDAHAGQHSADAQGAQPNAGDGHASSDPVGGAAKADAADAAAEATHAPGAAEPQPCAAPYAPPPHYDPSNPHLTAWNTHLASVRARNALALPLRGCGRLTRAAGLVLEAVGLRLAVGAEVMIELPPGSTLPMAEAEVVGFAGDKLFLMPTTEVAGLLPGARVWPLESAPIADPMAGAKRLPVGWGLLGRVLDASGRPLDGLGALNAEADAPLTAPVINPLKREPIHKVLDVGVRAINALLTV
ncbi:MAG TPA: flagellum-specific ATP synthase FliI, partial [Paraburkholderia sp.]|nr:flagellum-specific ATP synthase FliI [Paraburkholderia sp.]